MCIKLTLFLKVVLTTLSWRTWKSCMFSEYFVTWWLPTVILGCLFEFHIRWLLLLSTTAEDQWMMSCQILNNVNASFSYFYIYITYIILKYMQKHKDLVIPINTHHWTFADYTNFNFFWLWNKWLFIHRWNVLASTSEKFKILIINPSIIHFLCMP